MTLTDSQALQIVEENKSTDRRIELMREESKTLYALVKGENFNEELINQIDHIEGEEKAEARKKYARDIQDFFERLFQPIENIWYATGGNKVWNIEDKSTKTKFLKQIANIKDSNTLQHWIKTVGVELGHVDPNGLIFLEYTTGDPRTEVYPTYKNIKTIRNYKHRGQLVEWVLFEPIKVTDENNQVFHLWRLVDDKMDRTIKEDTAGQFSILSEDSFEHPFGEVPAIINSNVAKIDDEAKRLSYVDIILGLAKEYSRDQSIKTIYKFLQGFPIHWRYVTECEDCKGLMKIDGKTCSSCSGRGYKQKGDVTDMVTLPAPTQDNPIIGGDIAGHISPDIETWEQYNVELDVLERVATITFWGTPLNSIETFGGRKTTTEVHFNKQPIENRLNQYADYMEFIEWKLSEWILNFVDLSKNKDDQNIKISYGRNYVIEPSDTILARYNEARNNESSDTILDELFRQYLQAEYRTNPVAHEIAMKKALVEPYLHQKPTEIMSIFGPVETQRKILFTKWWDTLDKKDFTKPREVLEKQYEAWFEQNRVEVEQPQQQQQNPPENEEV